MHKHLKSLLPYTAIIPGLAFIYIYFRQGGLTISKEPILNIENAFYISESFNYLKFSDWLDVLYTTRPIKGNILTALCSLVTFLSGQDLYKFLLLNGIIYYLIFSISLVSYIRRKSSNTASTFWISLFILSLPFNYEVFIDSDSYITFISFGMLFWNLFDREEINPKYILSSSIFLSLTLLSRPLFTIAFLGPPTLWRIISWVKTSNFKENKKYFFSFFAICLASLYFWFSYNFKIYIGNNLALATQLSQENLQANYLNKFVFKFIRTLHGLGGIPVLAIAATWLILNIKNISLNKPEFKSTFYKILSFLIPVYIISIIHTGYGGIRLPYLSCTILTIIILTSCVKMERFKVKIILSTIMLFTVFNLFFTSRILDDDFLKNHTREVIDPQPYMARWTFVQGRYGSQKKNVENILENIKEILKATENQKIKIKIISCAPTLNDLSERMIDPWYMMLYSRLHPNYNFLFSSVSLSPEQKNDYKYVLFSEHPPKSVKYLSSNLEVLNFAHRIKMNPNNHKFLKENHLKILMEYSPMNLETDTPFGKIYLMQLLEGFKYENLRCYQ